MKAVLFDWDGVLVDSTVMYYEIYCQLCEHYDKYLPIHSVEEFREWYNPAWENNYFEMGFTRDDLPMVSDFVHEHIDYAPLQIFPGVPEVLADLATTYKIAIVSTTPKEAIWNRLEADNLGRYIDFITGNDGVSEKTAKIANTLQLLGCKEAVMVGDTPLDISSGQANSLPTVGTTYGWVTPHRIHEAKPSLVVDSARDLGRAIRSLLQ